MGFNFRLRAVIRVHDLRHTFASWLVQEGESLYGVSKALRHSSMKPSERYAHLELHHLRDTVATMDKLEINFSLDDVSAEITPAKDRWEASLKRKKGGNESMSAHNPHIDSAA